MIESNSSHCPVIEIKVCLKMGHLYFAKLSFDNTV